MSYNLVIVESPGKIETITSILAELRGGDTWEVKASYGHFRELAESGSNDGEIVTGIGSDFELHYQISDKSASTVSRLSKMARDAKHVYIASDADREGESIAWHLYDALGLDDAGYSRLVFSSIDVDGFKKAFNSLRKIDMNMVRAQEARRALDRIVGYVVSPELRRQTGENLSAGRVQSVAVFLVVLRERQRQKFVPVKHYSARLNFTGPGDTIWFADWMNKPDFVNESNPYITDQNVVMPLLGIKSMSVASFVEKPAKRNPHPPFITTTLQQAASNALGFSAKKTMEVAQALFDAGKISYMRTDNPNVAESAMPAIQAELARMGVKSVDSRRIFKGQDDAQEAHPGVTPVYWDLETAGTSPDQQALYKLIRLRALASQATHATYKVREAVLVHPTATLGGKAIRFGARGRVLVDLGFLKILKNDDTVEDQDSEEPNPIPLLTTGTAVAVKNGELTDSTTKAPARYTEATLVAELARNGIGRPATYATILENIQNRNYIAHDTADKARKGKQPFFAPTSTGIKLIMLMVGKFRFLDVNYTRELELDLDDIAKGRTDYTTVVKKLYTQIEGEVAGQVKAVPTFVKVPEVFNCECGQPLYFVRKHGFWGCTAHKAADPCSNTYPDNNGKPGKRKPKAELSNHLCGSCSSPLRHLVKKGAKSGYNFWGCSKRECKQTYPNIKGQDKPDFSKGRST